MANQSNGSWLRWVVATGIASVVMVTGLGVWGDNVLAAQERRVQRELDTVQMRITEVQRRQEAYQGRMETKFSAMHHKINEIYKLILQNNQTNTR